ncbi:MAG: ATP-dependent helicase [Methanobrevibacter sp. CfCl-M3]
MYEKFNLNEDQKKAAEYCGEKPLLIEAGSGTGKTRVLIERVEYLVNVKGINPESLLIITFSKKAAKELVERLLEKNNTISIEDVSKMHISTIHSFCHDLLQSNGFAYRILDESESSVMYIYKNLYNFGFRDEKFFKKSHTPVLVSKFNEFTSFNVDIDKFEEYVKDEFNVSQEYIDFIKETQEEKGEDYFFPESEVKKNPDFKESWYNARYNNVVNAYRLYLEFLEVNGFIDYSLLQSKALDLLINNQNLLSSLKYKNILIDEFQDTDPIQMKIFEKLMENSESFTVVGDDEQSIYDFRGGNVEFFKNFEENYDAEVIPLQTNYRSNESIVKFTENFIKEDRDPLSKKQLHSSIKNDSMVSSVFYTYSYSKESEAESIVQIIKYLKESGKIANYSDVGIIGRSIKRKINFLTEELRNENISFDVVGNDDLLDQDEIKSVLLLLYYIVENDEKPYIRNQWERNWLNLSGYASKSFNFPKLSEKTRKILYDLEEEYKNEILTVEKEVYEKVTGKKSRIQNFDGVFNRDDEILIEIFNQVKKPLISYFSVNDLKKLGVDDENDLKFFNRLYKLKNKIVDERNRSDLKYDDRTTLLQVYYDILDIIGYFDIDFIENEDSREVLLNLSTLGNTIYKIEQVITRNNIVSMFWFLYHNLANYSSKSVKNEDEVQIMTAHKSKGLEFPVVIVYGLEKDKFPMKFKDDEYDLTASFGKPRFPTPFKFYGYEKETIEDNKEKNYHLEERRILYVAVTRAEDILILSLRKNREGEIPIIEGIDLDSISLINDNQCILPKTRSTLNENKNEEEKLILSYSSIKTYETCPFKYNLIHKLNFNESDDIYIKKGNFTHKILYETHHSIQNNQNIEKIIGVLPKEVKDRSKKELENIKKYQNSFLKEIKVLDAEFKFQIEMNGEDEETSYLLEGQIDLVYEREGKIGIMDFKTTSKIDEEEYKKQLYIYLKAVEGDLNYQDREIELAIYLLNSNTVKFYEIDENLMKKYLKKIDKISRCIQESKFQRNVGTHCAKCTFNFICEKDLKQETKDIIQNVKQDIRQDVEQESKGMNDAVVLEGDISSNTKKKTVINLENGTKTYENEPVMVDVAKNTENSYDNLDDVVSVVLPDYNGIEDIGDSYGISAFSELKPTSDMCSSLSEAIQKILTNEHQVHVTHLSKLLLTYLNQNRVTDEIRNQIISEIRENELGNIHDDFIYLDVLSMPVNTDLSITPRIPNGRPIDHIGQSELMEGMFIVVDKSFTHTKESLFNETGKLFGFKHLDDKVFKALDDAFKELSNTNRITLENDIVKTDSLKIYEDNLDELKRIYENKEKITRDRIKNYFSSKICGRFTGELNSLSANVFKEIDSSLSFITMASGNTHNVVGEIEKRVNVIKSLIGKIDVFAVELETVHNYEKIILDLKLNYQNKEKIVRSMVKNYFSPEEKMYDRFIGELNSLSEVVLREIDSSLSFITMVIGNMKSVVDEIEERINLIKSSIDNINDFTTELEKVHRYEKIILDLKLKYQEKEDISKKLIKERFPPPQITYDRFMDEIDSCNEIFYNRLELTSDIIDMAPGLTNKALNELKEKVETLTSLKEEIKNLVVELTIHSNNSSDISDDEVKDLINDMKRLNSSVKKYK